ncbi:hypothetical protein ACQP2F_32045 [Actinoplanes sp. CA-030573]|uniref:hypothetical protein n=1 Tax=Actinoplanes sp. CA-030573 TaxID=3239898 RepID=UPI003D8A0C72
MECAVPRAASGVATGTGPGRRHRPRHRGQPRAVAGHRRESRKAWLASLDAIAAFGAATVVTGHKDPDAPDDDARRVLDQSRRYLEDFEEAKAVSGTPREVIDRMLERYPAHGNRHTLWAAAYSQFAIQGDRRARTAASAEQP